MVCQGLEFMGVKLDTRGQQRPGQGSRPLHRRFQGQGPADPHQRGAHDRHGHRRDRRQVKKISGKRPRFPGKAPSRPSFGWTARRRFAGTAPPRRRERPRPEAPPPGDGVSLRFGAREDRPLGRASLHRSGRGSLSAAIGGNREGVPSLGREKNFFRLARKRAKNGGVRPLRGRRPAGGAKMAPEDPRRSLLIRFPGRGSFRHALAGHCRMPRIFHRFEAIHSLPPLPGSPPVSSPKKGRNGKSGRQTAAAF